MIPRPWFAALLTGVCLAYVFLASAGFRSNWPIYGAYHDLMAEGFRAGQLHIPLEPHPKLLAAENPYDPVNMRYWALDASYYKGKYYIYWGPVPAMLQAVAKAALGVRRIVGDQFVCTFLICLAFVAGALLIDRIARRVFGIVSKGLISIAILTFAFANPTPHAVTTAGTYNTAIMAGQAWLLVGLVPALDAVWHAGADPRRNTRLLMAGVAWALALASRVSVVPTIALFIAATVFVISWKRVDRWRSLITASLWMGIPVAISGVGLLVHNKLRFDDWLEFGLKIQTSGLPTLRVSSEYLWPNLFSYALRPFEASCEFPYFFQVWRMGSPAFPAGFQLPRDYLILEPVVGFLITSPILWSMPLALIFFPRPWSLGASRSRTYLWCILSFFALATVTGVVGLGVYSATMRYMSDVMFGMLALGIMGAFALRTRRWLRSWSTAVSAVIVAACLVTIGMGLVLGYQGYGGHFFRHNPTLHAQLVKALSTCKDDRPRNLRYAP
ncbi:MAG TPA: hypothetical protein VIM73_20985 [Polyangiaceae bacterium]